MIYDIFGGVAFFGLVVVVSLVCRQSRGIHYTVFGQGLRTCLYYLLIRRPGERAPERPCREEKSEGWFEI
jgi:hypothetical protein